MFTFCLLSRPPPRARFARPRQQRDLSELSRTSRNRPRRRRRLFRSTLCARLAASSSPAATKSTICSPPSPATSCGSSPGQSSSAPPAPSARYEIARLLPQPPDQPMIDRNSRSGRGRTEGDLIAQAQTGRGRLSMSKTAVPGECRGRSWGSFSSRAEQSRDCKGRTAVRLGSLAAGFPSSRRRCYRSKAHGCAPLRTKTPFGQISASSITPVFRIWRTVSRDPKAFARSGDDGGSAPDPPRCT